MVDRVNEIDFSYTLPSGTNAGKTVREVFCSKIALDPDRCWHWIGKQFKNGYGCFMYKGSYMLAHRVSYELHSAPPGDFLVRHTCDNPLCVNPNHLVLGTQADNAQDMVSRGRQRVVYGERSTSAKLSDEDVDNIREARANGVLCKQLADKYGVSTKQISVVARGVQRNRKEKVMTPSEYVALAMRTNKDMGFEKNVVHAAMLLTSESGEVMTDVKRMFAYNKPLDSTHVVEELGDVLWGVALMCHTLGVSMEEVMGRNIKKLEKRYPDLRFDADRANNRDVAAEQEAMSK